VRLLRRIAICPARSRLHGRRNRRIIFVMDWTTPSYEELKMDAEIGSYQEDFEPERDPIAQADAETLVPADAL
jgi:hypothetical protein